MAVFTILLSLFYLIMSIFHKIYEGNDLYYVIWVFISVLIVLNYYGWFFLINKRYGLHYGANLIFGLTRIQFASILIFFFLLISSNSITPSHNDFYGNYVVYAVSILYPFTLVFSLWQSSNRIRFIVDKIHPEKKSNTIKYFFYFLLLPIFAIPLMRTINSSRV